MITKKYFKGKEKTYVEKGSLIGLKIGILLSIIILFLFIASKEYLTKGVFYKLILIIFYSSILGGGIGLIISMFKDKNKIKIKLFKELPNWIGGGVIGAVIGLWMSLSLIISDEPGNFMYDLFFYLLYPALVESIYSTDYTTPLKIQNTYFVLYSVMFLSFVGALIHFLINKFNKNER